MREMALTARTPEKEAAFLEALAGTCNVSRSAELADVPRRTVYEWRDADPLFAAAWEHALRIGAEALEDEAKRRAFEGVEKQHFKDGRLVATTKEFSDTLAIFLLKGANPEKFRERTSSEISGPGGKPIEVDDVTAPDKLAAILGALSQRAQDDASDLA